MQWSVEQSDLAKSMWVAGKSSREIAAVLGDGFTRSAIIGKMHREKMPRHTTAPTFAFRPRPAHKPSDRARPHIPASPLPLGRVWKALPGTAPISLLDLSDHTCRWPVGERPFRFCGCETVAGSSYCATHSHASRHVIPTNHTDPILVSDTSVFNGAETGENVLRDGGDLHELST